MKSLGSRRKTLFTLFSGLAFALTAPGCASLSLDALFGPDDGTPNYSAGDPFGFDWGRGGGNRPSGAPAQAERRSWLSADSEHPSQNRDQDHYQNRNPSSVEVARQTRDVVLGMAMGDVRAAWGEPHDIETAGESYYGNARWIYYEGLSRRLGTGNARVVYFERGRVVGWDRLRD